MTTATDAGTRPPFDPEIAVAMHERRSELVVSMTHEEILPLRARPVPPTVDELTRSGAYLLTEHVAPGPAGDVPVLVLRPAADPERSRPALLHLHGGGLVMGDLRSDVPGMLDLVAAADVALVSVGYRLAPEHRYPAAVEDAYAGLVWLAAHGAALGLDPEKIVISGVSAGGGLAAALTLLARDRGGPVPLGQMLICPMLDDRSDSASARQMEGHGSWDRTANATAWQAYLGPSAGGPDVPATAAAGRATDLRGLPPTYIDVASAETFRSECVQYAVQIWADGGDAELHVWPGGCHAFDFFVPGAALSRDARAVRDLWLRRLLARAGSADPTAS